MNQDLAAQIAKVRHVLRRTLQSGRCTAEARLALAELKELARRGDDGTLEFEHLRWSYHLAALSATRDAA